MSTTYTEADAKSDESDLLEFIESGEHGRGAAIACLSRLCTSALEGAQVAGLVEQVRTLTNRATLAEEQRTQTHQQVAEIAKVLDPEVTPDAWGCHEAAQKRMRELATLTAEREAVRNQLDRVHGYLRSIARFLNITEALSGPEFEVAAQEISTRLKTAESERDALRALVEKVRQMVRSTSHAMPIETRDRLLIALTAPPAEKTPDDRCPRGEHAVWEHERGGKHPLCGTDAETAPATEHGLDETDEARCEREGRST